MDRDALDRFFAEAEDILSDWRPEPYGDAMLGEAPPEGTEDELAPVGESYHHQSSGLLVEMGHYSPEYPAGGAPRLTTGSPSSLWPEVGAIADAELLVFIPGQTCDTCSGNAAVRLEAQIGAPGSGGWITCPDCGPTPSEPIGIVGVAMDPPSTVLWGTVNLHGVRSSVHIVILDEETD